MDQPENPHLWLCGASKTSVQIDGSQWQKEVEKEDYIPCPFPEEKMEPLEWIHSLISLDTMHVRPGPKFCDEEGYDIHPLNMISLVESNELEINIPHLLLDEVSVESVFPDTPSPRSEKSELEEEVSDEDWEVPKEELDKVRLLLKNRESVNISINPEKKPRRFCKSHQRQRK